MPMLVAIQVLRAVAALAIAAIHLEPDLTTRTGIAGPGRRFPWEAGVDVFFVISGFVMVYASGALFGRDGGTRAFLTRRIARVAPLYWLTTSVVLLILAVRPDLMRSTVATPGLVVASYAFIPAARPDGLVQPVYTLGWTLNYEMFFYAIFALAIVLRRHQAVAAVSVALAAFVATGLAAGPLPQPLGFWSDPILLEFVIGMWLGLARAEGIAFAVAPRLVLAALGLGLFVLVGGDAVRTTGLHQAVLFGLPAACLVAACGLGPGRGRDEHEPLPARIGAGLGDASYAIYLLHPFAIRGVVRVGEATGYSPAAWPTTFTAVALGVTIAVGLATFRIVERPLTRLARRALRAG